MPQNSSYMEFFEKIKVIVTPFRSAIPKASPARPGEGVPKEVRGSMNHYRRVLHGGTRWSEVDAATSLVSEEPSLVPLVHFSLSHDPLPSS